MNLMKYWFTVMYLENKLKEEMLNTFETKNNIAFESKSGSKIFTASEKWDSWAS